MFGATAGRTWFTDQAAGGGQVLERASHGIDLVQAIAGPAVRVSGTGANVPLAGADRPADSEIDDVLALTLELERGAVATVAGRLAARRSSPRTYEIDVIGDGARVTGVLDPEFRATGIADGAPVDLPLGARRARSAWSASWPPRAPEIRTPWPARPRQATASLATALACEQALKSGGRVTL